MEFWKGERSTPPVKLLKGLGAQIDLSNNPMCFGVRGDMDIMPSGHATTSVSDFGPQGEAKDAGLMDWEFRECDEINVAMSGIKSDVDPNLINSQPPQDVFAMASCPRSAVGGRRDDALGSD